MSTPTSRVPAVAAWIVASAAPLVPGHRRDAWRRQWIAELEHRCADGRGGGVVRFVLGAFRHALYLRREDVKMAGIASELRHAARGLLRRPGFSVLTVATLAIGIGAATAVFSLAEALLLRPLPLEHDDRLVRLFSTNARRGVGRFSVSHPDFVDFTQRSGLFEAASFYSEQPRDVAGGGDPERIRTAAVSQGFFQTLGSPVALGRAFNADDHGPRAETTVVLARTYFESRYGADSALIGGTIRLDGVPHTVIGVVDDAMAWPSGVRAWTPLQWGGSVPEYADRRSNHAWQVVARLRPELDVPTARSRVEQLAEATYAASDIDPRDEGTGVVVVPLHGSDSGDGGTSLFATLGAAVCLVLLIACLNASGLLLVRAWSRVRELSLRAALGAGRARLALVLFGETAVLAALGGGVGVMLGVVGLGRAFRGAPPEITALGEPRLNIPVLVAGLFISALAALLAGVVPAVRASRVSVAESLKDGAVAGGGRGSARLRQGLVVVQIAFTLALLASATLAVRGFQRQIASDPGFDPSGLISFTIRLPSVRYGEPALVDAFYSDAISRLERHPAIVAATGTSRLPLGAGGSSLGRSFIFEGAVEPPDGAEFPASWIEVDPQYFEALALRATDGRVFTADDRSDAPPVAIVNESMARAMSPEESIVGRRILSFYDERLSRTVVGVVPDIQINGVARERPGAVVFVPRAQAFRRTMAFMVRTTAPTQEMIPIVRSTMAELDGDVALDELQTLREAHAADLAGIRFLTTLFAAFGGLALVLAVSGVYGLVSTSVAQRRHEFGVRLAIGASTGTVRGAVLRESAMLAAIGLALGLGLAYAAGRVLAVGMSGVAVPQASTYVLAVAVLVVAVLVATWFPATRATRVDPVEALRTD